MSESSFKSQLGSFETYPNQAPAVDRQGNDLLELLRRPRQPQECTEAVPSESYEALKKFLQSNYPHALADFLLENENSNSVNNREPSNETCIFWTQGTCDDEKCNFAHYLFPKLVHRAHRGAYKTTICNKGDCRWPEDTCGFAHQTPTGHVERMRSHVRDRVEEQRWVNEICMRCKRCEFQVTVEDSSTIEQMVDHCDKCFHSDAGDDRFAALKQRADDFKETRS